MKIRVVEETEPGGVVWFYCEKFEAERWWFVTNSMTSKSAAVAKEKALKALLPESSLTVLEEFELP